METSSNTVRRRWRWVLAGLVLLVLAWSGRDLLWEAARAASAEMDRLSSECKGA
jgi:hypothetical protein